MTMTPSSKCSTPSNTSSRESTITSACTRLLATCHRLNSKQRFRYETNLNCLRHFWGALQGGLPPLVPKLSCMETAEVNQPFLTCSILDLFDSGPSYSSNKPIYQKTCPGSFHSLLP